MSVTKIQDLNRRLFRSLTTLIIIVITLTFFIFIWSRTMEYQAHKSIIKLPEPDTKGCIPLETTLSTRRSLKYYKDEPLSLNTVSQLLWSVQGITNNQGLRAAPSAGAIYPLDIYLVAGNITGLNHGVYLYNPNKNELQKTSNKDKRKLLSEAALMQEAIKHAPLSIVITGLFEKTTNRYNRRGIQYVYLEAGHAAQNLNLQAVALDLGSVAIGAFSDEKVIDVLKLKKERVPLYILPVGKSNT